MSKEILIIHLRAPIHSSRVVEMLSQHQVAVLDAPAELTSNLEERGAWVSHLARTREFRTSYYESIGAFLIPEAPSSYGDSAERVHQLIESVSLQAAVETRTLVELLCHLGGVTGQHHGANGRVVTDNDEGVAIYRSLRASWGRPHISAVALCDLRAFQKRIPITRGYHLSRTAQRAQDTVAGIRRQSSRLGSSGPEVVFFTDSPRQWTHLAPIHRELVTASCQTAVMTSRGPMARRLRSQRIEVAFARPRVLPYRVRRGVASALGNLSLASGSLLSPHDDATRESIRRLLHHRVTDLAPRAYSVLEATRRLAASKRDTCFIHVCDTMATGHAVTNAARSVGSPTALLSHGVFDPTRPELPYYPRVDVLVTWGKGVRDNPDQSLLPSTVHVEPLGWPLFEERVGGNTDRRGFEVSNVLVAFGRPTGRVVRRDVFELSANEALDTAVAFPNKRFVVKVHPADGTGIWRQIVDARRLPNVELVEQGDFYTLLLSSSVVVTRHSTAGVEAICAGKPLVVVDLDSSDGGAAMEADYVSFGAAYRVRERGELARVLKHLDRAGHGKDRLAARRAEYAARTVTRGPGSAAQRIGVHLMRLASGAPSTTRKTG